MVSALLSDRQMKSHDQITHVEVQKVTDLDGSLNACRHRSAKVESIQKCHRNDVALTSATTDALRFNLKENLHC